MASVREFDLRNLEEVGVKLAHELKNPLSAVKALVQLGLRAPAEGASHQRLASIEQQVTRMQALLQSHLASRRIRDEVTPASVHLGPLVSDTLAALAARADAAGVRLTAVGDAFVDGDRRRLEEVLLNLVANGVEATPLGGEVIVEIRRSGDHVEILVSDTGRGMPPESLRAIGTPFFTTRAEGTGLGVALAHSAIALHGGSLRYESEPGKGTTVTVRLPSRARAA